MHPVPGSRLRVYWVGEKRWFKGVVTKESTEDGHKIHHIRYDDGDTKWHNLADELWLQLGGGKAPPAAEPAAEPSSSASKAASNKRPAAASSSSDAPSPRPKKKTTEKEPASASKAASSKRPAAASSSSDAPTPRPKSKSTEKAAPRSKGVSSSGKAAVPVVLRPPSPSEIAALPPLINVDPAKVEVYPCGVIRIKDAVPYGSRQRLWDTVMCAGFDFREVAAASGGGRNGANMWYTQAAGAPDILLHYNYYEAPAKDQPPPMALLCAADAVFRETAKLEPVQTALEPKEDSDDNDETDDSKSAHGSASGRASSEEGSARDAAESESTSRNGGGGSSAASAAPTVKAPWVDEAAADVATLAENVAKRAADEARRLLWPREPNFRSVLAIGYRPTDTFRWHTDLAGEDGWVCSLSVGATAVLEYLPTPAPSALRRARARSDGEGEEVVRVEVGSGDAILFHGGLLAHRVSSVDPTPSDAERAGCHMDPYVRLNLQVRVYGSGLDWGLQELLERGFDYVR